jgi:hypothetical protein
MTNIDKDKLRELIADPKAKTKDIFIALGFNSDASFYYALKNDAEAKEIFDSRPGARAKGPKTSATKEGKKSSAKSAAPPAKRVPKQKAHSHTRSSSASSHTSLTTSIFTAPRATTLTNCAAR